MSPLSVVARCSLVFGLSRSLRVRPRSGVGFHGREDVLESCWGIRLLHVLAGMKMKWLRRKANPVCCFRCIARGQSNKMTMGHYPVLNRLTVDLYLPLSLSADDSLSILYCSLSTLLMRIALPSKHLEVPRSQRPTPRSGMKARPTSRFRELICHRQTSY